MKVKNIIRSVPVFGDWAAQAYWTMAARDRPPKSFPGSAAYWEGRYLRGGNSGAGSYGFFADFKAETINRFVSEHAVQRVIEFGCGDGNQLSLAKYPSYIGFDISNAVIAKCKEAYRSDAGKSFRLLADYREEKADLTLSLDVIYHLVEDGVFDEHMRLLFAASQRYVVIFSSDCNDNRAYEGTHVRHRKFTRWIADNLRGWKLVKRIRNKYPYRGDYRTGSFADFFIYEKQPAA